MNAADRKAFLQYEASLQCDPIDSSLADEPQSVTARQVTNGIAVRMAVPDHVTRMMASL